MAFGRCLTKLICLPYLPPRDSKVCPHVICAFTPSTKPQQKSSFQRILKEKSLSGYTANLGDA